MPVMLALVVATPVVTLMVLTGLGAARRGAGQLTAVVAALAFPVTWVLWYFRDEHPYAGRRARQTV